MLSSHKLVELSLSVVVSCRNVLLEYYRSSLTCHFIYQDIFGLISRVIKELLHHERGRREEEEDNDEDDEEEENKKEEEDYEGEGK